MQNIKLEGKKLNKNYQTLKKISPNFAIKNQWEQTKLLIYKKITYQKTKSCEKIWTGQERQIKLHFTFIAENYKDFLKIFKQTL